MFYNEMTKKMPCWKCKRAELRRPEGNCPIIEAFLDSIIETGIKKDAREHISGLTFKCNSFEEI